MQIVIPGNPLAQQRHRHTYNKKTGRTWAYDPLAREKALIKERITATIIESQIDFDLFEVADIEFIFYMPIPKYMKKKEKEFATKELLRHTVKPDTDNLIKLYLDCMVKIILADDKGVDIKRARKIYSPNPRTEIIITEGLRYLDVEKPRHVSGDFLECDKPSCTTIDVPPYSKFPYYSDIPQLDDMYNHVQNKAPQTK